MLASNLIFLLAFFTYFLFPAWWSLGAALLLASLLLIENHASMLPPLARRYRRLRAGLTLLASLSMLVVQFAR